MELKILVPTELTDVDREAFINAGFDMDDVDFIVIAPQDAIVRSDSDDERMIINEYTEYGHKLALQRMDYNSELIWRHVKLSDGQMYSVGFKNYA